MDQDALVNDNLGSGQRLIAALVQRGCPIEVALWAKLSGEERWVLYLASPRVAPLLDDDGLRDAYKLIHSILRSAPDIGIDPFGVVVVGVDHPLARAAAELIKPKVASGPFAAPNPKPYRGVTRFGGSSLGGFRIDGAYIYPPWEPGLNPVG